MGWRTYSTPTSPLGVEEPFEYDVPSRHIQFWPVTMYRSLTSAIAYGMDIWSALILGDRMAVLWCGLRGRSATVCPFTQLAGRRYSAGRNIINRIICRSYQNHVYIGVPLLYSTYLSKRRIHTLQLAYGGILFHSISPEMSPGVSRYSWDIWIKLPEYGLLRIYRWKIIGELMTLYYYSVCFGMLGLFMVVTSASRG